MSIKTYFFLAFLNPSLVGGTKMQGKDALGGNMLKRDPVLDLAVQICQRPNQDIHRSLDLDC